MMDSKISDILQPYQIKNENDFFREGFSRNIGLLSEDEQEILKNARIAIPGLGGVGGTHLITMIRSGIGNFNISDFDIFEPANLNRQFGASLSAFGQPKIEVMKELALSINPFVKINTFPQGVTRENIDTFLADVDVVLDGLDFFNFDIRRLLFKKAREKGIHVVTAGPMGFSSALLVFSPDKGMGFDEYFNITKGMKPEQQYLAFAMGLAPRPTHVNYMDLSKVDLESQKGPSLNVACQLCAGIAGTEAIRIILKRDGIKPVPYYCQFDPYLMKLRKGHLLFGNKNPIQRLKTIVVKYILDKNKKKNQSRVPDLPKCDEPETIITQDKLTYLLKAGIQAPSGDNAQPWKFSCSDTGIQVYLDKEADHSFFNVDQIASVISCGAVIENIKIAASQFGFDTQVQYLPDDTCQSLMAEISLSVDNGNKTKKDDLADSLWKRETNRKFYQPVDVPDQTLHQISQTISPYPGTTVHFITKPAELKKMAKLIYQTDQIRTQNRSLHEHLNKMIRFTDKEAQEKKDGFPIQNLEAGIAGELFLKATKSWAVMNLINKIGISKLVALHSYKGTLKSSGIALLTTDGIDKHSFLKGGQALERIWLAFTQKNLKVQPMAAMTLFRLQWQLKGKNQFSTSQQKMLSAVWKQMDGLFPMVDFKKNLPVMLFRFGQSDPIACRTLRKDIESFILRV